MEKALRCPSKPYKIFSVNRNSPFRISAFLFLLSLVSPPPAYSLTNGLALTPPMGWNSWYNFTDRISETLIEQMADTMATNGMKDAGYEYVNIDNCWSLGNDVNGLPIVDTTKFPSGMKALGDHIHSKGLKFGLYSRKGLPLWGFCTPFSMDWNRTGYANVLASWGVDFMKIDNAPSTNISLQADYAVVGDAFADCGRPIVYSICVGVFESWMPSVGNLWRTTIDIGGDWSGVTNNLDQNNWTAPLAGPGQWNDPDILVVGRGSLTYEESKANFTMWCMVAAPLIAGNDLRFMPASIRDILTASEVIAVDQDPAGIQGTPVSSVPGVEGNLEVWSKPLGAKGTTRAVALFNRSLVPADISVWWTNLDLGIGPAQVRDLWAR